MYDHYQQKLFKDNRRNFIHLTLCMCYVIRYSSMLCKKHMKRGITDH